MLIRMFGILKKGYNCFFKERSQVKNNKYTYILLSQWEYRAVPYVDPKTSGYDEIKKDFISISNI